jgi:hypothetical protein
MVPTCSGSSAYERTKGCLTQQAGTGEIVASRGTVDAPEMAPDTVALPPQLVKESERPVIAYRLVDSGCHCGGVLAKEGS